MYDLKETTEQAAKRLGLPEQFTAMHEGRHVCIDGRHYNVSCLVTDPDCDDIARSRLGLQVTADEAGQARPPRNFVVIHEHHRARPLGRDPRPYGVTGLPGRDHARNTELTGGNKRETPRHYRLRATHAPADQAEAVSGELSTASR